MDNLSRESFEKWVSSPPYEEETDRYPNDSTKYAWPGNYKSYSVQLAWEAWSEAARESENLFVLKKKE